MHFKRPKDWASKKERLAFCPLLIFMKKCCRSFFSFTSNRIEKRSISFYAMFQRHGNPEIAKAIYFNGFSKIFVQFPFIHILVIVGFLPRLLTLRNSNKCPSQFGIVLNLLKKKNNSTIS